MSIITLILAGYIALGWLSLGVLERKQKHFSDQIFNMLLLGGFLLGILYIGKWLQINQELIFLFGVGVGSLGYLANHDLYPNVPFLLFIGTVGYYWYAVDFISTFYLLVLSAGMSFVVHTPLMAFPALYEKETLKSSLSKAYILSIVAFSNIILLYAIYGIKK